MIEDKSSEYDGWKVALHRVSNQETFATYYNVKMQKIAIVRSGTEALRFAKAAAASKLNWVNRYPVHHRPSSAHRVSRLP